MYKKVFNCKNKVIYYNNILPLKINELTMLNSFSFDNNKITSPGIYILHNNTCSLFGKHVYKIIYCQNSDDVITKTNSLIPVNPNKIIFFYPCLDIKTIEHVYTSLECFYVIKYYYECHLSRLKRIIEFVLKNNS